MSKKTITPKQKKILIEFLDEHPEFVLQKQTNQYTNADTARLWREITLELNAIPGPQKSWKEWRKTWSDLKSRTKKKVSEYKKEANRTGDGPNIAEGMDEVDNRILEIIGTKERPPARTPNRRLNMGTTNNRATIDAKVEERTNQINESYYNRRLELMQKMHEDNVKLRREEIQLRRREVELKQEELKLKKQELELKAERLKLIGKKNT